MQYLKKLETFTVNKILLAIQPINLGKVVVFAYSDSSIEYRDRFTMLETYNDGDLNKIWHLSQIGFTYQEDEPCKFSHGLTPVMRLIVFRPTCCPLAKLFLGSPHTK